MSRAMSYFYAEIINIVLAILIIIECKKKEKNCIYFPVALLLGFILYVISICAEGWIFKVDYDFRTQVYVGLLDMFFEFLFIGLVIKRASVKNSYVHSFDGIIYGVMVAIGFSFFENLFINSRFSMVNNVIYRSSISSLDNVMYGAILGFALISYKELSMNGKKIKGFLSIVCGFIIAVLLHSVTHPFMRCAGKTMPVMYHMILIGLIAFFVISQYIINHNISREYSKNGSDKFSVTALQTGENCFCPNCGNKCNKNMNFCERCGTKLNI